MMDVMQWKMLALKRIQSGAMSDEEWQSVADALLQVSEGCGIEIFDDNIEAEWQALQPKGDE